MSKNEPNQTHEYTCDACGGTFSKGWSDENAVAEMNREWGDIPVDKRSTVCETCYIKFNEWLKAHTGHA
jgi:protein-arginine kinase activator protein McsA